MTAEASFIAPTFMSFLIADIKHNDKETKILEFGEVPRSKLKGHDVIFGTGACWASFWRLLKRFNQPIYLIGALSPLVKRTMAFNVFLKCGGRHINGPQFASRQLKGFAVLKGISLEQKEHFARTHNLTVINHIAAAFVNNKAKSNQLFDVNTNKYRPLCGVYDKNYTPGLAKQIQKSIPSSLYVIKPVAASRGRGVEVVNSKQLDQKLVEILGPNDRMTSHRPPGFWAFDRSPRLIIEQYCRSKPVQYRGKPYDGTMRAVFAVFDQGQEIITECVGYYWKLPPQPTTNRRAPLHYRVVSAIHDGALIRSSRVSNDDKAAVFDVLKKIMPPLHREMQKRHRAMKVVKVPRKIVPQPNPVVQRPIGRPFARDARPILRRAINRRQALHLRN